MNPLSVFLAACGDTLVADPLKLFDAALLNLSLLGEN